MRVVFATHAEWTHFSGMVPLAWALHNAGHEVRVASQPAMTGHVTRAGLTSVPVGGNHNLGMLLKFADTLDPDAPPPFDFTEDRPEKLTWDYLTAGFGDEVVPWWWRVINDPMIGELTEFCRQWRPDLVIWEPITFAGPIAAKACGAAHVRFVWSADLFGAMRGRYVQVRDRQPPDAREDALARWIGLRGEKYAGVEFSEDMTTGQATIDYTPPSLRLDVDLDYVPLRFTPYTGRSVVPDWLRAPPERPRVCLTLGTSAVGHHDAFKVSVQDVLTSLGELDVEVVATLPRSQAERLTGVPPNTTIADFVPLNVLLPTCSAVINHGGPGTVFTALTYGVPQLVLPSVFDELILARRLAEHGAGLTIAPDAAKGTLIADHVRRLLNEPSLRAGAARIRGEMLAMPSPAALVPTLERLVADHRGISGVPAYPTRGLPAHTTHR
ncbi:activator-dependent family glycosyltransferase [Sinosporangium siamense]|uniref:Glycosyl transferase n=1 Tax=Sinosporangium siamense TaxID=1367973 RepID=A0A919VA24_9ACTN|nr:activator-dependent family glycosyltransferase [Sinosporangium siamense]GII90679.1 glycosyl transferase [Sinosporangium siamense]